MREIARSAAAVTHQLIQSLDARLPGQLEAFYLVGSIALGDYREGQSDVDFIAILADEPDVAILQAVHADLARHHPALHCDGIYLRPGELSAPAAGSGIEVRDGRLRDQSAGERHPVTWLILADAGIALRGRAPDHHWVMAEREAAIGHSRANLQAYWRPWLEARRRLLSPVGPGLLKDGAVVWGCLGIARLYATIATGRVPSKSGAGQHALGAFPAHGKVIAEALRLRGNPGAARHYRSRLARRRDLIAFMDAVLTAAA